MAASDWTAALDNIVTSAAIIVGGVWAGWKWGYGEKIRKGREHPDLDGTLTASAVPLPAGKAYLTLQAEWRNPGPLPIRMCPDHTFIEQYELAWDPPAGSLRLAGYPGAVKISKIPLTWPAYTMGPQTASIMTEHFVVAAGPVYAFTWVVCQGAISRKNKHHGWCSRELIWARPQTTGAAKPGIKEMINSIRRPLSTRWRP